LIGTYSLKPTLEFVIGLSTATLMNGSGKYSIDNIIFNSWRCPTQTTKIKATDFTNFHR